MKIQLKPLSDRVIVITGASSGIGLTTARKAAGRGAKLVLAARNERALQEITKSLNDQGTQAVCVVADVGNEEDVRRIAQCAIERFGRFDIWMNIAGIGMFGKCEQVALKDMRRLFETNFWGIVHGSLAALPHLKSRGGALINMGSEASDRAVPLQGIYSASKHAVKGFTEALRMELEEEGAPVSVSLIKPASIDTMLILHAKNYLDSEPKLPPPIYAPDVVADALLYAAERPTRDMFVGSRARIMSAGAYHAPRLLDKGMERFMYTMLRSDRPSRSRDDNNLYTSMADQCERGGVCGRPRETSFYTSASMHPRTTRALFLGAGLALVTIWQARRRQRAVP